MLIIKMCDLKNLFNLIVMRATLYDLHYDREVGAEVRVRWRQSQISNGSHKAHNVLTLAFVQVQWKRDGWLKFQMFVCDIIL